ncbi:MAG: purine-cytosine permease family protein [Acidimicrobiales bacterium]
MTVTATDGVTTAPPEDDQAFHIERRGIDYVPESERWAKPRDLAGMWAGASVQIEYFVYGAILIAGFGFSFPEAVSLIIIGNLSYFLLGLCSLQGPDAGTTVFAINRASYGPQGSRLISFFNWLTQIGFEVEGIILIVGAVLVLAIKAGFNPGKPAEVIIALIAIAIQAVLPFLGHATIVKTLRWLIVPCVIVFAILLGFVSGHTDLAIKQGAFSHGWQPYMVGLAFTIALSGLGWTECGNDYSRYIPRGASSKAIVGWVFVGTALPEILVMILGAVVGTVLTGVGTSANAFLPFVHQSVVPSWFVIVFLVFAIVQLFGINSLDLYSSGVTLQALGARVKRYQAVLIDSVICVAISLIAIFNTSFNSYLKDFVAAVICWIAPWVAVYLVDWALRKYRYVPMELQRTDHRSIYWASGGVHWPAIIAQAVGTVLSVLSLDNFSFYIGPIAKAFGNGGADFSVFFGPIAAAIVYLVLGTRSVRKQAVVQDEMFASLREA